MPFRWRYGKKLLTMVTPAILISWNIHIFPCRDLTGAETNLAAIISRVRCSWQRGKLSKDVCGAKAFHLWVGKVANYSCCLISVNRASGNIGKYRPRRSLSIDNSRIPNRGCSDLSRYPWREVVRSLPRSCCFAPINGATSNFLSVATEPPQEFWRLHALEDGVLNESLKFWLERNP